jgi:AcrR family transcriptional regulator
MDGFERRKEQSKEDIRRAAKELFSQFGADKVSINDIARKAGVSQATIYNNFGSKEELVHDYRKKVFDIITQRFHEVLVWKKSFVEKFQGFLQSWIDITDRYKIEIEATKSFSGLDRQSDNNVSGSDSSIDMEIEGSFLKFIKEGKQQGNIRKDLSEESVLTYLKFFQQGISNNPETRDKIHRDAKFSQDLFSLFIYGIRGENN